MNAIYKRLLKEHSKRLEVEARMFKMRQNRFVTERHGKIIHVDVSVKSSNLGKIEQFSRMNTYVKDKCIYQGRVFYSKMTID